MKVSQVEEEQLLYLRKLFNRISPLKHPNILNYHAMYINMSKQTCYLVMDYIPHPTLSEFLYPPDTHQ